MALVPLRFPVPRPWAVTPVHICLRWRGGLRSPGPVTRTFLSQEGCPPRFRHSTGRLPGSPPTYLRLCSTAVAPAPSGSARPCCSLSAGRQIVPGLLPGGCLLGLLPSQRPAFLLAGCPACLSCVAPRKVACSGWARSRPKPVSDPGAAWFPVPVRPKPFVPGSRWSVPPSENYGDSSVTVGPARNKASFLLSTAFRKLSTGRESYPHIVVAFMHQKSRNFEKWLRITPANRLSNH